MLTVKQIVMIIAATVAIPVTVLLTFKICRVLNESAILFHNANQAVNSARIGAKELSKTLNTTANKFNAHSDGIFSSVADILKQFSTYIKQKGGFDNAIAAIVKAAGKK